MPGELVDSNVERALLSEALRRHDRYLSRGVAPNEYASAAHQAIAEALQEAWELGAGVNVDTVALSLQRAKRIDLVGGYRGLAEIAGAGGVPDVERLREFARLRAVHQAALEVMKLAEQGSLHAALSMLADVQSDIFSAQRGQLRNASEIAQATLDGMGDDARSRRMHPGLASFARTVGWLIAGSMTVVGGDTNTCKSSFVLEMFYCAAERNVSCGMISVEDPEDVTGSRLLANETGVSSRAFQLGHVSPDDRAKLVKGVESLKRFGDRLLFEDCTGGTELDVCAAMTRMAARGARIIAVDYIQEIECSRRQQDRRNEVRWLVKRLKTHAKRLGVALICVSQLSRPKDGETGREPSKHQLKESGDVTNSAEVILLLWREREDDSTPIRVKVAKVKWGGVGQSWQMKRDPLYGGRLREIDDVWAE